MAARRSLPRHVLCVSPVCSPGPGLWPPVLAPPARPRFPTVCKAKRARARLLRLGNSDRFPQARFLSSDMSRVCSLVAAPCAFRVRRLNCNISLLYDGYRIYYTFSISSSNSLSLETESKRVGTQHQPFLPLTLIKHPFASYPESQEQTYV